MSIVTRFVKFVKYIYYEKLLKILILYGSYSMLKSYVNIINNIKINIT